MVMLRFLLVLSVLMVVTTQALPFFSGKHNGKRYKNGKLKGISTKTSTEHSTTDTTTTGNKSDSDATSTTSSTTDTDPDNKFRAGLLTKCDNPNHFALTFDDGPYLYTSELVKLLQSENVKATFFVNGQNYWQDSDSIMRVLKEAYDAGNEIASHTFTHPHLPSLSEEKVAEEMFQNEDLIYKAIGKYTAVMRPPYGEVSESNMKLLNDHGYSVVSWTIDIEDWKTPTPTVEKEVDVVRQSIEESSSKNIVLGHDVFQQTATGYASAVIDLIKSKGLTFVTVSQCLGVDAYKSHRWE